MRISDWSSDVCSSDLGFALVRRQPAADGVDAAARNAQVGIEFTPLVDQAGVDDQRVGHERFLMFGCGRDRVVSARIQWMAAADAPQRQPAAAQRAVAGDRLHGRSEEHTSELQSLMRNSYAVFCLK